MTQAKEPSKSSHPDPKLGAGSDDASGASHGDQLPPPCDAFPPIAGKRPLPPVWQDEVLKRIAEISLNPKVLHAALKQLRKQGNAGLLDVVARSGTQELTNERRSHIKDHWLNEGAEVMLRGAIEASEASIASGLPINAYWVFGHQKTQVAICQSSKQITLLIMRPYPQGIPANGEARTQWGITILK